MIIPALDLSNGHVVRLKQGDFALKTVFNVDPIKRIFDAANQGAEYIENLLNLGVERVVVGSVAVKNPELVRGWLNMYGPEHFTLALDVRLVDGVPYVATHGWLKTSNTTLDQVLRHYLPYHIEHVLVTDISKDGMMSGANNSLYAQLYAKYPDLDIIASGGISSLDDVKAVARAGAHSVVLGRSLLEGKFTVEEAVKCWQNA